MKDLLTRDDFRNGVFNRDHHKCVICGKTEGLDVHHIIDRRLWDDGGYYLSNGATLCSEHHVKAEQTVLGCDEIRTAAKIDKIAIPPTFYGDEKVDKWGNVFLPNGLRLRGELFFDESVAKILKSGGVLNQFTEYVKYPKTPHLPWSPGITSDDRVMSHEDIQSNFVGKKIIVTEKCDGENFTLYPNYLHARSIDGRNHVSRSWIKQFHAMVKHDIPDGWRVCGENLYAKHSIAYSSLSSFFLVFAIFNDKNTCLGFEEMVEYCQLIGFRYVVPLISTEYNEDLVKKSFTGKSKYGGEQEGYVVRLASEIPFCRYRHSLAKYVRKNHVQTAHNWMYQPVEKNGIIKG